MKKAFTMIELVFVIVIIGILAMIAIPKMAATRDDAKISLVAADVANAATEIAAYTMAKANTTADFSEMSNAVRSMKARNLAVQSGNTLNVKMNTISDCLKLRISSSSKDRNLTIAYGNAGGDTLCVALQSTIDTSDYPIPLKGHIVNY